MDDASTLFYDFDAFGSLIDARPYIEQIAHANRFDRKITIGPNPAILYYTGKHEIFAADTVLGWVSASHNPRYTLGGPKGAKLENTIFVTLAFKEAVKFDAAIFQTSVLLGFFEMLVGRPQNLLKLSLRIKSDREVPILLQVHWSMRPKREQSYEEVMPHPADVLLDAVSQPEVFSGVLVSWLDREQSWRDARLRFSNSFAHQLSYDIDRLIGSANMFDILPSSAVPPKVELAEGLKLAKKGAHALFKSLPDSPERSSVLGALGRVGTSTLKQKIGHRAQGVFSAFGERLPELFMVTDEAVNCRNYYVHATGRRFDYNDNFDMVVFFINILEFVFAASDLIEAGWDAKAWSEIPTSMSHPFARYRIDYATYLHKLQILLAPRPKP